MFRIGFLSPRTIIKDFTAGGKYVSAVTGNTTVPCAYRVTLLNSAGTALWTDSWRVTSGTAFSVSLTNNGTYLVQTIRMELRALCARAPSCTVTIQAYQVTGSHQQQSGSHTGVISTWQESKAITWYGSGYWAVYTLSGRTSEQWYTVTCTSSEFNVTVYPDSFTLDDYAHHIWGADYGTQYLTVTISILGTILDYTTVYDYGWVSSQLSL
jgi:hypothetical protein